MRVAVGFRPHTGWAIAVAVGRRGPEEPPTLVLRERVQLCPDDLPRMVYHAAAERSFDDAEALVERVCGAAMARTGDVLDEVVATLDGDGHEPAVVAVIGLPRTLPDLAKILAAHPLLHAAEGELYRGALADAAADRGLPVYLADPKAVQSQGAVALGMDEATLVGVMKEIGAANGPPWQKDHRDAVVAALTALQGSPGDSGPGGGPMSRDTIRTRD